jgi:bacillolysin
MRASTAFLGGLLATVLAVALAPVAPRTQRLVRPLTFAAHERLALDQTTRVIRGLQQEGNLRLVDVTSDPLAPGRTHQRLVQLHQGVRVLGGGVSVQTDRGQPASVFGHLYPDIAVATEPELSLADIVAMANRADSRLLSTPELAVILDPSTDAYRLIYHVRTFGMNGLRVSEIDATTGAVISERNALTTLGLPAACQDCVVGEGLGVKGDHKKLSVRSVEGTFVTDDGLRPARVSTYDMRGDWSQTFDVLVGLAQLTDADLARDADNVWQDGVSVDGHVGSGWTLDYLYHRFGRQGLDGQNSPVVAIVHPVDRADFFTVSSSISSLFHLNAFFCGSCGTSGIVVFGEGLPTEETLAGTGQALDFFAAGIDIVAHELGHAVTEFTSQLVYRDESGALSEAFSDLIGVGTEFFMAETGRHPAEDADYVIGEDVIKPGGVRSLANPLSRGDPDHYSLRFLGQLDNGGVHTNSTIVSHAYYLAIEGGTNVTSGIQVFGLGPKNRAIVDQIFYRAFVFLLSENATFSMARAATLQSARDLMAGTEIVQTIAAAWTAVGVE